MKNRTSVVAYLRSKGMEGDDIVILRRADVVAMLRELEMFRTLPLAG